MVSRVWLIGLLAATLLVSGCRALSRAPAENTDASPVRSENTTQPDPSTLTSGKFTTRYGTLHIGRELIIHNDGQITEKRTVVATDEFARSYRGEVTGPQGWEFSHRDEGHRVVMVMTKAYQSAKEFNAGMGDPREGVVAQIRSPLFQKLSFRATVAGYDKESMRGAFGGHPQATSDDWVSFLGKAIIFEYRVTMPTKVTKSSDGEVVGPGTTFQWRRSIGQLEKPVVLSVESKRWGWLAWVVGGALVLVIGGISLIRLSQNKWDPEER